MVKQHMASEPDYKIIVFFVTARLTQFMAALFNSCLGIPTLEIHSRKSQGNRTTTSQSFRNGKNVILFSSDVSARGVDYPDVTLVLQVSSSSFPALSPASSFADQAVTIGGYPCRSSTVCPQAGTHC